MVEVAVGLAGVAVGLAEVAVGLAEVVVGLAEVAPGMAGWAAAERAVAESVAVVAESAAVAPEPGAAEWVVEGVAAVAQVEAEPVVVAVVVAEQGKVSGPAEYTAHSVEPQRIRPVEQPHIHQEFAGAVGPAAARTQQ